VFQNQRHLSAGVQPFHIFAAMHLKKFVFNPFQENTYLIWDEEKNCAIIDPGCADEHERKELTDFIEKEGLHPVKLLNTHCHVDHVLGNKFLAEKYDLKLEMHQGDVPVLNAAVLPLVLQPLEKVLENAYCVQPTLGSTVGATALAALALL
jgi:glyoxylase-like metal-dependent hydrolase (beta-lactamase superfamily II)